MGWRWAIDLFNPEWSWLGGLEMSHWSIQSRLIMTGWVGDEPLIYSIPNDHDWVGWRWAIDLFNPDWSWLGGLEMSHWSIQSSSIKGVYLLYRMFWIVLISFFCCLFTDTRSISSRDRNLGWSCWSSVLLPLSGIPRLFTTCYRTVNKCSFD